jgi:amino acid adenylation domain-containing protein
VSDANGTLSYAELDARARRLARRLVAAGVSPGEPVGILLPRSASMIVAILGALQAGAAYVPLDPAYPAARRAHMVNDSGMRHLVTDATLRSEAPGTLNVLLAEAGDDVGATLPEIDLEAPAYLIYTSGSTGQPKAVEVHHRALSHSTQLRFAVYPEPVRAYLLLSSFAFDSSVAGIFWTLAQGGCLVLPAPGEELAVDRLGALIEQHRVSHGLSLPSLYEALLEQVPPARLRSLGTWIVAGEACPATLPARHAQQLPHATLVNEYGPTEATVWATVEVLEPGRDVTIGRPLPTMGLQVLTEHGVPAAIGEPGEIVLSGPTLARGYRGRPDETARAFAPLPDSTPAYRTGDLACWRPDGRLAFLGRKDHQVKLRGYRIELGEIERRLREHAAVRDAAVVVRELPAGRQLVAYVIPRSGETPPAEMLKRFVAEQLPPHMVPVRCVSLGAFPRTPNGKLDLQALPDPDAAQRTHVAPRNEQEAVLAEIVAAVLRRPVVGVLDNFFEIGGDSILSLQLVARARERGLVLSARQVFDHQTVAAMATAAERVSPGTSETTHSKPFAAADLSDDELRSLIAEIGEGH